MRSRGFTPALHEGAKAAREAMARVAHESLIAAIYSDEIPLSVHQENHLQDELLEQDLRQVVWEGDLSYSVQDRIEILFDARQFLYLIDPNGDELKRIDHKLDLLLLAQERGIRKEN